MPVPTSPTPNHRSPRGGGGIATVLAVLLTGGTVAAEEPAVRLRYAFANGEKLVMTVASVSKASG